MKKTAEYQKRADECRMLARGAASEDERAQLMAMAETWLSLAEQRLRGVHQAGYMVSAERPPPGSLAADSIPADAHR